MDISSLRKFWNQESKFYKKVEVGTGVQSFVKKVLESEEIFDLREGKLSTKPELRNNEFIHEKPSKEKRKADFYIYITSEVTIPVEVECYQNIDIGEKQLFNYQKDFEKHYGILTDGNEWRFYNNNIYKAFSLSDILDKTAFFVTFWKEYIKPEFYYLSFFEKEGQLALLEETKLHVEDNHQLFFEDITKLIQSFKYKLEIEGYFEENDEKTQEKRSIELTYAYIIQFILYKTLVDNDFDDFLKEFEAIVSKIYTSLKDKRYKEILGVIDRISAEISSNVYHPFIKEQDFIRNKMQRLYHSLENTLSDVSPWLDIFIFIKKYNFANVRNEIFGYIYENYLKELYDEGKKGQYFTDPAIVNFMIDEIGYSPGAIKKLYEQNKDSVSIIDPSCGSGTFLYSATDTIVKAFQDGNTESASKKIEDIIINNIFGLDIEEFPLYLAEMSILMRMLPLIINEKYNNPFDKKIKVFWTRDSIAEFIGSGLKNTVNDTAVAFGQQGLFFDKKLDLQFDSYMREKGDLEEMKRSMRPPRRRFDYVIGNPPYISYNESASQNTLIFNYMKQGKVRLSDIFGLNLHSIPGNKKKYPPKPNLYAFFMALGLILLKDNGKLCYIIPQNILTAGDLDVLRYHLAKFTTIQKIITFSGKMFLGRGLRQNKPVPTSSLIFVVSKITPSNLHEVEIVNYLGENDDLDIVFRNIRENKKIKKQKLMQMRLLQNLENWNFIKRDSLILDLYTAYKNNNEDMAYYYDHILAEQKFKSKFYFDVGFSLLKNKILNVPNETGTYDILDFKYFTGYSNFVPHAYYPKDRSLIKLTKNSQGYVTLERKYKIVWSVKNPDIFYFTANETIFNMGKAAIICSDDKSEILYLLSLLNSPVNKLILTDNLKNEQEKDYLVPIKAIKEFIKVPAIKNENIHIKELVIQLAEKLLDLEKITLSNLVDFSKVLEQKFDKINVDGSSLILEKDSERLQLPIKNNSQLIAKVIKTHFNQQSLGLEKNIISLNELMSLPVIDVERQKEIKEATDNLVFCLYFNIYIPEGQISDVKFVKSLCEKNKFYKTVSNI